MRTAAAAMGQLGQGEEQRSGTPERGLGGCGWSIAITKRREEGGGRRVEGGGWREEGGGREGGGREGGGRREEGGGRRKEEGGRKEGGGRREEGGGWRVEGGGRRERSDCCIRCFAMAHVFLLRQWGLQRTAVAAKQRNQRKQQIKQFLHSKKDC